jgi:3-oxoacyl-[acyl-carrier-protein] synthase-3
VRRVRIESLGVSLPRRGPLRWGWGSVRHAVAAGRRCLRESRHRPADVGVLVNAGVHRDDHVCEPAGAAYIQRRLGINVEFQGRPTSSFDLLNGGCGVLNAAQVVAALLESGEAEAGLVVASEADSDRRPDPSWPYAASGGALLLDLSPRRDAGFGAFSFCTREEHAGRSTSVVRLDAPRGRLLLHRDPGLEELWLGMAREAAAGALERDRLGFADIDLVVPAQVSAPFLARLPGALGTAPERHVAVPGLTAYTLSTSVVLALAEARRTGRTPPGTRALLLAFGSGLTVAAATYRF